MHNFRNLKIWQKSVEFVVKVYEITASFPKDEIFGLASQMRRAAVSIPSNIAEGSAKSSTKSFCNSLEISLGESYELETQFEISKWTGLIKKEKITLIEADLVEIQKMIVGLKASIGKS